MKKFILFLLFFANSSAREMNHNNHDSQCFSDGVPTKCINETDQSLSNNNNNNNNNNNHDNNSDSLLEESLKDKAEKKDDFDHKTIVDDIVSLLGSMDATQKEFALGSLITFVSVYGLYKYKKKRVLSAKEKEEQIEMMGIDQKKKMVKNESKLRNSLKNIPSDILLRIRNSFRRSYRSTELSEDFLGKKNIRGFSLSSKGKSFSNKSSERYTEDIGETAMNFVGLTDDEKTKLQNMLLTDDQNKVDSENKKLIKKIKNYFNPGKQGDRGLFTGALTLLKNDLIEKNSGKNDLIENNYNNFLKKMDEPI